jgi:hypothetical protein
MGLDPLHDPRKVFPFAWYDEQVYMGGHNTKIRQPKGEFFPCVLKDKRHGFPPHIALKNPLFVIGPGRNMVRRPLGKFTFFSHKNIHT